MNILYISYDGMTDPLGQSQVLPYIIGLTKEGYNFTLISAEKRDKFEKDKHIIEDICKKNKIDWQPIFYTKKPPILSTVKDTLKIRKLAFAQYKEKKFKAVHCRSYLSSIIGLEMQRKLGVKFIFDMRGFWADERVDGNLWNLKIPIYKTVYNWFKKREKSFLEKADAIVSLTHNAKQEMETWKLNRTNLPIYVIPCCADLEHFDFTKIAEIEKEELRKKWNIQKNEFVLSYLGSIGTWYLLDEMLLFYKSLLKKYPTAKFLFITPEPPELILPKAVNLGLNPNQFIIQKASRKEVPLFLSVSDWSVFFIKPSYSKKSSSPTKQAEIMSMGIPVVCNDIGDAGLVVNESKSGLVVNEFTESSFDSIVQKISLLKDDEKRSIRQKTFTYFDLADGVAKYANLYQNILK